MTNDLPIYQNILFSTVYTKEDLLLFYKEIDQIMSLMFTGTGDFTSTLSDVVSPEKKDSILAFLKNEHVRMDNPVDIKVCLAKIQKLGNALPVVSLQLAFEPTEKIIKDLSVWFLKRFSQKVILDISLERSILGGAFISYNGLYKDYTLQTKVEKYFNKQQSAVV